MSRRPNILLLITDQQRYPRHWPAERGWHQALAPNDAELARTGISFTNAFCNASMCSPSRATLLTGRYPASHGVTLTLTSQNLRPEPRNAPWVVATMADMMRRRRTPHVRLARQFARGMLQLGPRSGDEPVLDPGTPNLARLLRGAGYEVAYKGKWHLTHPLAGQRLEAREGMLGGWSEHDAGRLAREYGFADWEPPDAGENAKAENFGGGNAGEGEGWDEVYTRQVERWLARRPLPEPFCLVVSLVNPHDVLGYPMSYVEGGYAPQEFRDLGVELPPTVDEDLGSKPGVHALMRMGMTAYLGPLRTRRQRLDYVNFYAHLHRVVDEKIGRVLAALGDPGDPASLRSRTLVVRCADHGEMGLSHGGLRQKAFNAYEETIHLPLVFSNPVLFPRPAESGALASLIDVVPTLLRVAGAEPDDGLQGHDVSGVLARATRPEREALRRCEADFSALTDHPNPAASVQEAIHFTYDDHSAGTALQEVPGQPNRVRCVRDGRRKYALYFDPAGRAKSEYEMYDLERDPEEAENLLDHRSGEPLRRGDRGARDLMRDRLDALMGRHGTAPPRPSPGSSARRP